MRAYLAIAVVIVLAVGFSAKTIFFPNLPAAAHSPASTTAGMDVFQMHLDHATAKDLPEQRVKEPF